MSEDEFLEDIEGLDLEENSEEWPSENIYFFFFY